MRRSKNRKGRWSCKNLYPAAFPVTCDRSITSQRSVLVCASWPLRGSRRRTFTSTRPPVGFLPSITWHKGYGQLQASVRADGGNPPSRVVPPSIGVSCSGATSHSPPRSPWSRCATPVCPAWRGPSRSACRSARNLCEKIETLLLAGKFGVFQIWHNLWINFFFSSLIGEQAVVWAASSACDSPFVQQL